MKSPLFWDFKHNRMEVPYQLFAQSVGPILKRRYGTSILRCVKFQKGADLLVEGNNCKGFSKKKVKVHPRTGHECPVRGRGDVKLYFLAFYGPCIVIYLRNKNQPDALSFLMYSNKYPLHVSNRLNIHPQQAVYCTCSLWHLSCIHVD